MAAELPTVPHITEEKRVLSVQSHVVSGYAGNKSAVFPLQLLGYEVDYLNTVQFSNHTGPRYGRFKGQRFDAQHLEDIFSALDANGLFKQSHLLTGYTPSAQALETVSKAVDRLRQINPNLVYVCDTVCGDDGRLYVAQEVIPIYKQLISKATVITPNQFEAEIFADAKITSVASLKAALTSFHTTYGLPNVVISSLSLPRAEVEQAGISIPASVQGDNFLICAGSSKLSAEEPAQAFVITFPKLDEHYEGVGDVFSSLTCAYFNPTDYSNTLSALAYTAEHAIASLSGVILNTRDHAYKSAARDGTNVSLVPSVEESADHRMHRLSYVELRLIQSAQQILNPTIIHTAQPL